jgi:hypothetical protein
VRKDDLIVSQYDSDISFSEFLNLFSPLGVAVYGEKYTLDHQVSFGLIWAGLAVYVIDALRSRRATPEAEPVPEPIDGGVPLTDSQLVRATPPALHDPEAKS